MGRKHLEYFDFSKRGDREAVLVIQHFHFFDGKLLIGILVLGEEDNTVGPLPNHLTFLKLTDESAVQGVHQSIIKNSICM